jgi:predicted RND superfamily exporter protein
MFRKMHWQLLEANRRSRMVGHDVDVKSRKKIKSVRRILRRLRRIHGVEYQFGIAEVERLEL